MTALEISPWTERWAGCIASKENNGKLAHAQYHGQRRKGFIGRLPQAILHHPQFKAFPIIFSSTVKIVYSRSTVTEHFCVEKTVTVQNIHNEMEMKKFLKLEKRLFLAWFQDS